jgi:trans-2-enoyl-CoA reductase
MPKVSAIVIHEFGPPLTSAKYESVDLLPLTPRGARVRMLAAPINPADLNVIEGKYPLRPELPGVPGVEGVGVVEEIGADVAAVRVGDRVLLPQDLGAWREVGMVADVAGLIVVPPEIPLLQAAMLKINPATALRLMSDFAALEAGDWILQNAANSAVGRAVIQLARVKGLRTVNFVRRPEVIDELKALGADVVVLDEGDPREEIATATARAPLRLALNAVGGDSALRLAKSLTYGGTVVTYGAMGRQPLKIPNALLIFQNLVWCGFWISQWYRLATAEEQRAMFAELFELTRNGILNSPVERVYPLEEVSAALAHASQSGRQGKILFGAPEVIAALSTSDNPS